MNLIENRRKWTALFTICLLPPITATASSTEIYRLENGRYILTHNYILQDDKKDAHYNADTIISLTAFPNIRMKLEDIFEEID